ncbi:MAG TPA: hypothetical protein VE422_41040 [Terriglobia bacterium]|nr:hypothetical protein [Terriglobia bacterium]
MHRAALVVSLLLVILASTLTSAQTRVGFNLSGMWSLMYHEDELERTDPGSPMGDYLGIPINDDARLRADTWDADLISVLEHQCIPHSSVYAMRAPSNLKISTIEDPTTAQIVAFVVDETYTGPRTIWMDGRPHPSQFAAHTFSGFSTGVWEGDTLRVETTHIKAGYLRRNGIPFSDEATMTEFFDLHEKYLTLTSIAEDPIYLTEPLVRSESWVWNVLLRMSSPESGAAPGATPSLTFNDRKVFEFNGEAIEMFAEAGAHTDGDSIVFFRGSNVISTGDVFLTTGYPVIDLKRGGSIQGEINALNHILALSVPHAMQEGGTMIIPGHGRLCDQADVTEYRDMMSIIRDRIADLVQKGKTLDEVKTARPTRDYDRRYSTNSWTGDMLAEAVYRSLKEGVGRDEPNTTTFTR